MPTHRLTYSPEIDGLRAVAVLSVFLFHLNRQLLPGGFVGVDVFFVISGYLITSTLVASIEAGRFSFANFYQRRIARLLPALTTVSLATVIGAWIFYTPQDFASSGAVLAAATLSVANLKFMLQDSYFNVSQDAQPFLHYWSLSVEEQFYFIFPAFIFYIYRSHLSKKFFILILLGGLSLTACVAMTATKPIWAFYLLPTRAWELLAGCLLAAAPLPAKPASSDLLHRWLPISGLGLLLASLMLIQEGPNFPGAGAVLPVASTAMIIASRRDSGNIVTKFLALRPFVAIGKVSYSLYLWHWPVFCLIDYRLYSSSEPLRLFLKISTCVILTLITYHLIEKPARAYLNKGSNRTWSFVAFALVLATCVPLGISIRNNHYINATPSDVASGGLSYQSKAGAPSVVLMGDSNGSMYGKVIREICKEQSFNLTVISVATGVSLPSTNGASGQLWYDSLAVVRATKPDYLIVANAWTQRLREDPRRLALAIKDLEPSAGLIILINQPPELPAGASRAAIRNNSKRPYFENTSYRAERRKTNSDLLGFQSAKISVLDAAQYFESTDGEVVAIDEQGRLLFHDATHLSGYGALRVRPLLSEALTPASAK